MTIQNYYTYAAFRSEISTVGYIAYDERNQIIKMKYQQNQLSYARIIPIGIYVYPNSEKIIVFYYLLNDKTAVRNWVTADPFGETSNSLALTGLPYNTVLPSTY